MGPYGEAKVLAIGIRIAEIALREVGPHSADEEIVAIVETDMWSFTMQLTPTEFTCVIASLSKKETYNMKRLQRWMPGLVVMILAISLLPLAACSNGESATSPQTAPASTATTAPAPTLAPTATTAPSPTASVEPLIIRLDAMRDGGYPTPFAHYPRMRGTVMKYIFDSLLEPDEEGYIPWLAESWDVSDDYKTYTFNIRPDVKWHDGQELTAHDVVFSFRYYQEYPPVFTSDRIAKDYLLSVEALSDYQVEFVTASPDATFLSEVGMMRIIPEHVWKDVDNPYEFQDEKATIGCGPYMLTDYSSEHGSYRYVAFDEYWGPQQRIDVIELVPASDPILALENRDIDIARIKADVADRFREKPGFVIVESPALAGTMLNFNMRANELFQNKAFRQAIAHAIDKADIIAKIQRGLAKPGSPGILPIDHQYYNPEIVDYAYDPVKARQLLQEAGIDQDISIELLVDNGSGVRIAEILKEQLSDVGIKLDVVSVDPKSRDARVFDREYEMALIAMGSWGLDADFLRIRYNSQIDFKDAGGSLSAILGADQGYQNAELDRLLAEQRVEVDPEKRKLILFEIQEMLAQDVPEIPLFNNYYLYAYNADKYDGWTFMFDHPVMEHAKLSYLQR